VALTEVHVHEELGVGLELAQQQLLLAGAEFRSLLFLPSSEFRVPASGDDV
jgi:hypothetical protein